MSEKKKFTVYVGSVALCVGVAVLLHYVSFTNPYLQSICHLLRPFIYIGLYLVWAISFQKRIIQKEPRRCLIMIAVMMVFWMLVRMCKFEIPYEMPTALRYAWYLYYIPMLLLPTVSLYLAFYIRQPENYKLPERRCLLFFPALFLIGIVLTNDLHQLVFTFPEGRLGEAASYEVGVYGYGAMYYAIVAWDLGCLLAALLIILLRCRKIKNRKMLWMPFGAYGLSVIYGIAYYLNLPFWKIFSSDMTAALCLLFALIIESCIQCGLIPSNTGYAQLFAASTISAQITDQSGKCIYQSQDSECIAPEIVRQVVQCPIMLENGIRLSGKPILGGYVLWKENLSELQEIVRELEDRKEELKDAKTLLYITDNCGEIVLDKIFIEELKKRYGNLEITVMVRGGLAINDATIEDAQEIGLTKIVPVISNGAAIAGTVKEQLSKEARKQLDSADVIIAKGMGNFESMYQEGINPYYLFLCKCDLFTRRFGVKLFDPIFCKEERLDIK